MSVNGETPCRRCGSLLVTMDNRDKLSLNVAILWMFRFILALRVGMTDLFSGQLQDGPGLFDRSRHAANACLYIGTTNVISSTKSSRSSLLSKQVVRPLHSRKGGSSETDGLSRARRPPLWPVRIRRCKVVGEL